MLKLIKEFSEKQYIWRNDPSILATTRQSGLISRKEHEQWIQKVISGGDEFEYFGIELTEPSKIKGFKKKIEIIGYCGFSDMWIGPKRNHRCAEYSLLISPEHCGKGYGTEAFRLLLNYGFKIIGLNRIEGEILNTNKASLRLAEKMGFTVEGTMRSKYFKNGEFIDSIRVGLLKEEWCEELG